MSPNDTRRLLAVIVETLRHLIAHQPMPENPERQVLLRLLEDAIAELDAAA